MMHKETFRDMCVAYLSHCEGSLYTDKDKLWDTINTLTTSLHLSPMFYGHILQYDLNAIKVDLFYAFWRYKEID